MNLSPLVGAIVAATLEMRFSVACLISLLALLLRSPFGLGATGPDAAKSCPEILPRLQGLLENKTSPARRAALRMIEFIKRSRVPRLPDQKTDAALYQQFLKHRDNPEFQATLRENPETWALIEPLLKRKEASPATRTALETLEYLKSTGFTHLPNYRVNKTLYERIIRYRHNPEFQAVLKENPQAWALIAPLANQKDLSIIRQAALDTLEYIKSTGFTKVPDQKENAALYQRFLSHRDDPEFQATLREDPKTWALIEHLFIRNEISPARQAALDMLEFLKSSGFTQLPDQKEYGLYQRIRKYRNHPELQTTLKEDSENWALIEPLLRRLVAGPAGKAALDTLDFIKRSGFKEVPNLKSDKALYARYMLYRDDAEFQAILKEHPQAWALIEPLLKQR